MFEVIKNGGDISISIIRNKKKGTRKFTFKSLTKNTKS